jgi:uncharacterized protein YfaS (alpha-2-macroglobulin family)
VSRFTLRLVTLVVLVGSVALGGAAIAIANTAMGSQNPDLTVTASLQSSGLNPEFATVGDTVTVGSSVTNNTSSVQKADVSATIVAPDGTVMYASSRTVTLPRDKTASVSYSLPVLASYAPGIYTLTVSAANATGASSASATITIY